MNIVDEVMKFFTNLFRQKANSVKMQAKAKMMNAQVQAKSKAANAINSKVSSAASAAKNKAADRVAKKGQDTDA